MTLPEAPWTRRQMPRDRWSTRSKAWAWARTRSSQELEKCLQQIALLAADTWKSTLPATRLAQGAAQTCVHSGFHAAQAVRSAILSGLHVGHGAVQACFPAVIRHA